MGCCGCCYVCEGGIFVYFVLVVFPGFCFLEVGSSYVGCVGCIASDVGLFRGRLRVVDGGGCGVSVVLFMSLIRWDLR